MRLHLRIFMGISRRLIFTTCMLYFISSRRFAVIHVSLWVVPWCSDTCHAWNAWYHRYRNLYFYTFENCLNACMIILVTYKLKGMVRNTVICVRFVSGHCNMTQEWQECYSYDANVTNLVTSRTHRSNTKRISSFGKTMITFQLAIRFEKFIFINFQ